VENIINKIGSKSSPVVIELKEFEGRKLIDIRKYFIDKTTNNLTPTRKGISLNSFQLKEFIETINSKSIEINNFLFNDISNNVEINSNIKFENLIGRSFKYVYENGLTTVVLDKVTYNKISEQQLESIKDLLLSFNSALFDVLDEQSQVDLILDRLDNKIKKIKW
jgi:hypothetical protein